MSKTIKVGDDTHAELEDRKRGSKESFDDVIRRELGDGDSSADIDVEQLADTVADRIEQSDYEDFDDWFSPDVARTIAQHVIDDMEYNTDPVTLEATEYRKIADEVEGRLQR